MRIQINRLLPPFVVNLVLLSVIGCSASQQFLPIPPDVNRDAVERDTIEMTAEDFHFTPEVLHVKEGTFVTLKIKSIDGTHGFNLGAFGIDERLDENETKVIEFYAGQKGEYGFRCSHFCGLGHLGMTGTLIIE
jgi:heme/copper-type cytochrome/quinol oxidase subunit 2